MKTNFKHYFFLLFAAAALLVGCDKSGTTPENNNPEKLSSDNSIRSFSFQKGSNPSLDANYFATSGYDVIYITVPEGVSLSSLIPSINTDPKATVKCGSTTVQSESTQLDFSQAVVISVTSESGVTRHYNVLVKNGNSKVDNMVYSFMVKHDLPGVSVSVSKNEEIVYSAGYGFANVENKERVTPDHKFRLASMSKQHAAIAIMTLFERGLLKLEDTVFGKNGILADEFGDNMPNSWKSITLEHLLSHTSGITTDCIFGGSAYSGKNTHDRVALLLQSASVAYEPGSTYSYNNSNFGIIGLVVEKLSGKKFMTFLKEEIYTPREIMDIDCGDNDIIKEKEVNYYGQGGKNPFGNDVEAGVAAGGVIASTPALMKLMTYLDYGTKVPDMFKKETLDRMYTPLSGVKTTSGSSWNRYALGWRANYPSIDTWTTYHGGTLAGVCTIWARGTDNVNGVVLCNSRSYDNGIDDDMWFMLEDIQDLYR